MPSSRGLGSPPLNSPDVPSQSVAKCGIVVNTSPWLFIVMSVERPACSGMSGLKMPPLTINRPAKGAIQSTEAAPYP